MPAAQRLSIKISDPIKGSKNGPKGFTLIELLVTISIIAILSAIALVVYSSAIKQGRDSKRQSDLRSIQSALEQYYADQLFYPAGNLPYGSSLTNATGNPNVPVPGTRTYLNIIPTDPTGTPQYAFVALNTGCDNLTTKCTGYCLYAKLENPPSPVPPPTGCAYPVGYNFALSLP